MIVVIVGLILLVTLVLLIKRNKSNPQKTEQDHTESIVEKHEQKSVHQESTSIPITNEHVETAARPVESETKPRSQKHKYVDYLMKERNVRYLVHFTPVDNLDRIIREGLVPRSCQEEKGVWTDEHRIDNMTDCNCLSISFPNYQMFYKKRQNMRNDFAVILIDPYCLNLFTEKDLFFLPHNAASVLFRNNPYKFTGLNALSNMFCTTFTLDGKNIQRESLAIPQNYTTSPQAELLIRGTIPPTYFREIHITNHDIIGEVRHISANSLVKVFWCDEYFRARRDYQVWRKQL